MIEAVIVFMIGGVVSTTFTTTVAVAIPPALSVTISVIKFIPIGRFTFGVGPVAVPNDPLQANVRGLPSELDEPLPSSITLVPYEPAHSTV